MAVLVGGRGVAVGVNVGTSVGSTLAAVAVAEGFTAGVAVRTSVALGATAADVGLTITVAIAEGPGSSGPGPRCGKNSTRPSPAAIRKNKIANRPARRDDGRGGATAAFSSRRGGG